jgi:hypothetical protein
LNPTKDTSNVLTFNFTSGGYGEKKRGDDLFSMAGKKVRGKIMNFPSFIIMEFV